MVDAFSGFAAFGTTVSIQRDEDSYPVPIWGVQDITGPQLSTDVADTTNHASPGRTEQRVATVKRTGTVSFPMVTRSEDAGQQALYDVWFNVEIANFVITKPSGIVHEFPAYVTSFGDSGPVTDAERLDVVLTPATWEEDATTFPAS